MNVDHLEDAVPSNAIATTALDEPAEFAGGKRLYAVLFDADYDAMSLDANGDLALLVDAEQAAALRDQFAEIAAALSGNEQSEEIVVRNMDASTSESIVEDLTELGIKREVIRVDE